MCIRDRVVGVRFLWVLVMERAHRSSKPRTGGQLIRDALVTTLSGPKGAITLSIIMTIPFTLSTGEAFPQRDNLIFLASGVILCTLLLANFVVPLLAPKEQADERDEQAVNAAQDVYKRQVLGNENGPADAGPLIANGARGESRTRTSFDNGF